MTIWKYPLVPVFGAQHLSMPRGARLLSVHAQDNVPCLWALADETSGIYEDRTVAMYGTGTSVPSSDSLCFLGTVLLHGGAFVLHVFARPCAMSSEPGLPTRDNA